MRLLVAAVGRLKEAAERELEGRYIERIDVQGRAVSLGPARIVELPESRAATAALRKADEADRLLAATRASDVRIVLDGPGRMLSSEGLAAFVRERRDGGTREMAFLVGGPDGHGEAARQGAALSLSLGPLTLPHGLARVVLVEQLYRTATILAGHPYHRA